MKSGVKNFDDQQLSDFGIPDYEYFRKLINDKKWETISLDSQKTELVNYGSQISEKEDPRTPVFFYQNINYCPFESTSDLKGPPSKSDLSDITIFKWVVIFMIALLVVLIYIVIRVFRVVKRMERKSSEVEKLKKEELQLDKNFVIDGKSDNFLEESLFLSASNSSAPESPPEEKLPTESTDLLKKLSMKFAEKMTSGLSSGNTNTKDTPSSENSSILYYENNRFVNCFSMIVEVGRGGYGSVFKAFHKLENKCYAIKKIPMMIEEDEDLRHMRVFREVAAMANLKHKNIVRYITSWIELDKEESDEEDEESLDGQSIILSRNFGKKISSIQKQTSHEKSLVSDFKKSENTEHSEIQISKDDTNMSFPEALLPLENGVRIALYIQMDFCKGMSLNNYIQSKEMSIGEHDVFWIFIQLVEGLTYIHKRGIIHRDLKPGNIFVDEKGIIKIGDFGLATLAQEELAENKQVEKSLQSSRDSQANIKTMFGRIKKTNSLESSIIGTPLYIAPEMANDLVAGTSKGDIYSLGIILYELLAKFNTFHERVHEITKLKKKGHCSKFFSSKYDLQSRIIAKLINQDILKRPEANEILTLPEFKEWHYNISKSINEV